MAKRQSVAKQKIPVAPVDKKLLAKETGDNFVKSIENFQTVFEHMPHGVAIVMNDVHVWHNPAFAAILGYDQDELIGKGPEFIVPGDMAPVLQQRLQDRLAGKPAPNHYQVQGTRKDGSKIWLQVNPCIVSFAGRKADLVVINDITKQKYSDEQLLKSENRYRTLADASPDYIFIFNRDGVFEYANQNLLDLYNWRIEDVMGIAYSTLFINLDKEALQKRQHILQHVFQTGEKIYSEDQINTPKGPQWFGTWLVPLTQIDETVYSVMGVSRDITHKKLFDLEIGQNEQKYRCLFENLHDAVLIYADEKIIDFNPMALKIFRCERQDIIDHAFADLAPEFQSDGRRSTELVSHLIRQASDGKSISFKWSLKRKDGALFQAETNLSRFEVNEKWHLFAIISDITERLQAENALRSSEARFRDSIERNSDPYFFVDVEGKIQYVNPAALELIGYSIQELIGKYFADLVTIEDKVHAVKNFKIVMGGLSGQWNEFHLRKKNGEEFVIAASLRRVIENGIVKGLDGFAKDITHIKNIEAELQRREARYRALFQNIPYQVFGLNPEIHFTEANQEFAKKWGDLTGLTPEQLPNAELGQAIKQLSIKAGEKSMAVQQDFSLEQAGSAMYYRIIISPILSDDSLLGFVGLNIDVTALTQAVKEAQFFSAQLFEIQEEERSRISREIHDSLGQILTALQLEIATVASVMTADPGHAQKILNEARKTITQAIVEARDLCHGLRPQTLDDFGLEAALSDYISEYQKKWKIRIDFKVLGPVDGLSKIAQMAIFRVVQEALVNVLKHAKALHITITLSAVSDVVDLVIKDDGKGFDSRTLLDASYKHLGLAIMKERIEFLGGQFIIHSEHQKGTTITIKLSKS
jgi:PAS domain S-box-containing protein